MIEMEIVQVGHKQHKGFKPNKTVNGVLCARTTRQWRGRKHIVWVPWRVEAMEDTFAMHGLDLEEELMKIVLSEFEAEAQRTGQTAEELMEGFLRLSGKTGE